MIPGEIKSVSEFIHHQHYKDGYQLLQPSNDLNSVVDFIHINQLEQLYPDTINVKELCFASFGVNILFPVGEPGQAVCTGGTQHLLQQPVMIPRHRHSVTFHFGKGKVLGVRCPVNFLGATLSPGMFTKNEPLSLSSLRHVRDFPTLNPMDPVSVHLQKVEAYLVSFLEDTGIRQESQLVSESIQYMKSQLAGKLRMTEIANEFFVSNKTLSRYFLKYTGCSPKEVFTTLRFRKALNAYLLRSNEFDFSRFGYFDYSHFYREIKSFTGYYPHQLLISTPEQSTLNSQHLTTV